MYKITSERLTAEEYIRFLSRTDLGSQYPRERFEQRIPRLLKNASVSLAARDAEGRLVGALLGLTDFAYWRMSPIWGWTGTGRGGASAAP